MPVYLIRLVSLFIWGLIVMENSKLKIPDFSLIVSAINSVDKIIEIWGFARTAIDYDIQLDFFVVVLSGSSCLKLYILSLLLDILKSRFAIIEFKLKNFLNYTVNYFSFM